MLVYTTLVLTTVHLSRAAPEHASSLALVGPATGIICLFFVVLFLLISIANKDRKKIKEFENRLVKAEADHAQTRHDHERIIEKRIFEIAVVNASLNREIAERHQAKHKPGNCTSAWN